MKNFLINAAIRVLIHYKQSVLIGIKAQGKITLRQKEAHVYDCILPEKFFGWDEETQLILPKNKFSITFQQGVD